MLLPNAKIRNLLVWGFVLALSAASGARVTGEVTLGEFDTYYQLSGSGTYSENITTTKDLRVDSTKRVTGAAASIVLSGNITAATYDQQDGNYSGYEGGQGGTVTLNGNSTSSFTGLKLGGHTAVNIGTNAASTATVSVAGNLLLGSSMTSNLYVNAGSTLNVSGGAQINANGAQGVFKVYGTVNFTSSTADSVLLGYATNTTYTSTLDLYNGSVMNVLNTVTHCGYNGQLKFTIAEGATANLYGLTFARNGDQNDTAKGSVEKTLNLKGGTLNLGVGGVSIRGGKDAYPFQLVKGTIGTIDGCDTTIANVQLAVGNGTVQFKPVTGAVMTVSSNFADSTLASAGTGGVVEMAGAGTLNIAGSFSTTGGLKASSGTTVISGTFAGGNLAVNGGTVNITGTLSSAQGLTLTSGSVNLSGFAKTGTLTLNGGTLTLNYTAYANQASNAPITVNSGAALVLSTPSTATASVNFYNPITMNGGTLTSDNVSGQWKILRSLVTIAADTTLTTNQRLELRGGLKGVAGATLTLNGGSQLILDNIQETGLKRIESSVGTLVIQSDAKGALVTTEGTYINGGTLQNWGVEDARGNIFMNGGKFQSSAGGNTSFAVDSSITFLKNTTFETTTYGTSTPNFTMKGSMIAADGITVAKTGARNLILTGNLDAFDGSFNVTTGGMMLANGGNTPAAAYDFDINLNGGTVQFTDSADYYFANSALTFSNTTNKTLDLGTATLHTLTGTTVTSAVSGAQITGTIDLGTINNVTAFSVSDGASLSVASAATQGGGFTKTGSGTLSIGTLNIESGTFNLSTSAVDCAQNIQVQKGAKITADAPVTLNSNLNMNGTFVLNISGTAHDWAIDTMDLTSSKNLILAADTIFELTSDSITDPLNWDALLNGEKEYQLLDTNGNFEGLSFAVAIDPTFSVPGMTLYAVGDVNGSVYLAAQLPEPASCVLLVLGVAGLCFVRKKKH